MDNIERLYVRAPALSAYAEFPNLWACLAVAAATHDLGKCAAGFQAMLRGGDRFPFRHEALSLAFLPTLLGADCSEEDLLAVAMAVATHHKDLARILEQYLTPGVIEGVLDTESITNALGIFTGCLLPRLAKFPFPVSVGPQPERPTPALLQSDLRLVLRKLHRMRKEIDPGGAWCSLAKRARLLRGALMIADHSASAHVYLQRGPRAFTQPMAGSIPGFPAAEAEWFEHQRDSAGRDGHAILIAPTGSGKTEAALFWAQRQIVSQGSEPTLYYVLPYQASMNAMHARLGSIFGPGSVTLQHSRAILSIYRRLLDDVPPNQAVAQSVRMANLARVHASAVRVLSPYQLLKAPFGLKGHEAMWTAIANSLLILDELHAYEPTRLGMILGFIEYAVRHVGVRVFAMSATFPAPLVRQLSAAIGGESAVSIIRAADATFAKFLRHIVRVLDHDLTDSAVLDRIHADSAQGRSVLVVATTVGRAQELHTRLAALHPELLHGRFHIKDRSRKESDLLRRVAAGGARAGAPVVLVATQVVEVSLNVDFDVLYSDPAPLEALLQRFGRVNRKKGGSTDPKPVHVCAKIPERSPVYDAHLVQVAVDELRAVQDRTLAENQVQAMLDRIYSGSYGVQWEKAVSESKSMFIRNVLESCMPLQSNPELENEFEKLFDGEQVLPVQLWDEYRLLEETQPLTAPELLVSVTRGQIGQMHRAGLLQRGDDGLLIANCPYGEKGLQILPMAGVDGI